MTSHWITECPHCGTSFRVTEQHLRAAKGSVRCGSCLQIFNAINTLFPDDAALGSNIPSSNIPDTKTPTPEPPPVFVTDDETAPLTQPTSSISVVEAFISGDVAYEQADSRQQWEDDQEAYVDDMSTSEAPTTQTDTPTEPSHRWGDNDEDYATTELDVPEINTPNLDALFIDTPELDEPFLDAIPPQSPWQYEEDIDQNDALYITEAEVIEQPQDMVDQEMEDAAVFTEAPSEQDDSHVDPYDQLESTLESIATQPTPTPAAAPTPLYAEDVLLTAESRIPSHHQLESEHIEHVVEPFESEWAEPIEPQEPHIGPYREPFRDALLSELEAEPPQGFSWQEERDLSTKSWLWGSVSLLLIICLGLQYVMFHYTDFASTLQKPPFEGWMRSVCKTVSCRFIKTDLSLVANENLLIRAHPTEQGFLVLDTMLYNRAPFEQPFPLLDLSFSNMEDKPIARRVFKPEEYLSGDLANLSTMPINTPLHISFAIKNPSELATNYELNLIPSTR